MTMERDIKKGKHSVPGNAGTPIVVERALPKGIPDNIEIIESFERYRELRTRYGLPNTVDVGRGPFGIRGGILFVDDDNDGKPVAFGWPDGKWRTGGQQ